MPYLPVAESYPELIGVAILDLLGTYQVYPGASCCIVDEKPVKAGLRRGLFQLVGCIHVPIGSPEVGTQLPAVRPVEYLDGGLAVELYFEARHLRSLELQ